MNIVFWVLLAIVAVILWASVSDAFTTIGSIAKAIKERVTENLNNEDKEEK